MRLRKSFPVSQSPTVSRGCDRKPPDSRLHTGKFPRFFVQPTGDHGPSGTDHTWPMTSAWIAILTLSLALGACSQPSSRPLGDIPLTFGRVIEDILPDVEGATVRFEVRRDGAVVFSDTYPVEFDDTDHRITLDTIFLEASTYEVSATVDTTQASCSVGIDLTSKVAVTVSALIRTDCFLEVEESEGWHQPGGATLPNAVVQEFYGGGHCGWEEIRFIALGEYFIGDAFVRDPNGVFDPQLFVTSRAPGAPWSRSGRCGAVAPNWGPMTICLSTSMPTSRRRPSGRIRSDTREESGGALPIQ